MNQSDQFAEIVGLSGMCASTVLLSAFATRRVACSKFAGHDGLHHYMGSNRDPYTDSSVMWTDGA